MLRELTSREAVLKAIAEFDRLGRDEFLSRHDFGRARSYFLRYDGRLYDSKAIAAVAHGYQWPDRGPLRADEFSGGEATVRRQLVEELGFEVVGPGIPSALRPERLEAGSAYSWDQLATAFGFKPNYLSVAGGMPVSSATNSVLLITHPRGRKVLRMATTGMAQT